MVLCLLLGMVKTDSGIVNPLDHSSLWCLWCQHIRVCHAVSPLYLVMNSHPCPELPYWRDPVKVGRVESQVT